MKAGGYIPIVVALVIGGLTQNFFAGIVAFIIVSVLANKMPDEFAKIVDALKKAAEQAKQGMLPRRGERERVRDVVDRLSVGEHVAA